MSKKNKEFSIVIRFIPVNRMQQEEYTFLSEEFDSLLPLHPIQEVLFFCATWSV